MEENYNCSKECSSLESSLDQNQLAHRLIKLRIRVLRANIGKLLCLCVPARDKWSDFGWDGKTVDDILDELSKVDIPEFHPGDPEFDQLYQINHEKFNSQYKNSQLAKLQSEVDSEEKEQSSNGIDETGVETFEDGPADDCVQDSSRLSLESTEADISE